jgi:uncharacterized RDD family membrane protein YckC
MVNVTRCPKCGNLLSDDLGGKCPECLLGAGLAGSSAPKDGPETVVYSGASRVRDAGPTPQPGQDFGGYHLVRDLGKGGMGAVFEAEELSTGRRLALKVLSHSLDSASARQRFLREGRLAASVNHPHSVYVFGTEEIDGAPVITMELVQGGTLQDRVRKSGPMPVADAVDAILQVLDGLDAAHAVGVLHRDVKPSNCFVDADGTVKIGDFGLSISKSGRGDAHHLTASGVFLGTPSFSSPEQLRGDELDHRSDLYAVGVTLFYLLTGKVPFEAEQMVQLVATVLEKPAPNVAVLNQSVPKELAAVVARLLEKDPARRYRSYAQAKAGLLPFSSFATTPAPPPRRFAAGAIDMGVMVAIDQLFWIVMALAGVNLYWQTTNPFLNFALHHAPICFAYFVIPEWLFGATLGKWLVGLRVVRRGSKSPPALWRTCLRSFMYDALPFIPIWLWAIYRMLNLHDGALPPSPNAADAVYFVLWALLFASMRRRNEYAAVHDLVTGVRVIVRPLTATRPMQLLAAVESHPLPNGSPVFGPYHVLAPLGTNAAGEWHLGYDARLLRKAWLCVVPAGAEPRAAALHRQSRSGRVRWLTGRRGPVENWDAFEAPAGQPLWTLLESPRDWGEVRFWLLDLSEELTAAMKDGTLPAALSLDRVWITADGRAKLCDLPVPGVHANCSAELPTRGGAVEPVREFLRQVAVAALIGWRPTAADARDEDLAWPLPLHARPILDGLLKAQQPAVIAAELRANVHIPARLSRARRWGMFAANFGVPVVVVFLYLVTIAPELIATAGQPDLVDFSNALNVYSPSWPENKRSAEEKATLATYIAGTFGERIKDPAFWDNTYLITSVSPDQRTLAQEIVATTPPPTPDELAKATEEVEKFMALLARKSPDAMAPTRPEPEAAHPNLENDDELDFPQPLTHAELASLAWLVNHPFVMLGVSVLVGFLVLGAGLSVIAALAFGGGLLWRIFGIVPVTSDGRPASRLRFAWRQTVAASWMLVFAALWALIGEAAAGTGVSVVARIMVCGVVVLGMIAISTFLCKRSWPDRLAGTWLVMR